MSDACVPATAGDDDALAVPFSFSDLFFSRTDQRGFILSGNSVFQRISQYEWDELLNKPHNIIRHPDMPRGVFYLLWDFLKRGKPIGAYVKNRAKDGRHYWVFAIITAVENGYLSVRLKPGSEMFAVVRGVYQALLAREAAEKLSPRESAKQLLTDISALGFDSYESFMAQALSKEVRNRDQQLGRMPQFFVEGFDEVTRLGENMMAEATRINEVYDANRFVPLNLQIQSAQLGETGRGIGVISSNFGKVSDEMRQEIATFNTSARAVIDKMHEGQFLLCTSAIQNEVMAYYAREAAQGAEQHDEVAALLEGQSGEYRRKAEGGMRDILSTLAAFREDYQRMKHCTISLEVIRVMGKVDAARLGCTQSGLLEMIDDLRVLQSAMSASLDAIEDKNYRMTSGTRKIVALLRGAA